MENTKTKKIGCWLVKPSSGIMDVAITVMDVGIIPDEFCRKGRIIVYSGETVDSLQVASFCEEKAMKTITKPVLLIKYFENEPNLGFNISYMNVNKEVPYCAQNIPTINRLTAEEEPKYIESPGYPSGYSSNLTVDWLIMMPQTLSYRLYIETEDSQLQPSSDCQYDNVIIYEYGCITSNPHTKFCGNEKPSINLKFHKYIRIRFTSDASKQYRGFKLKYYTKKEADIYSLPEYSYAIMVGGGVGIALGVVACILQKKNKSRHKGGSPDSAPVNTNDSSSAFIGYSGQFVQTGQRPPTVSPNKQILQPVPDEKL